MLQPDWIRNLSKSLLPRPRPFLCGYHSLRLESPHCPQIIILLILQSPFLPETTSCGFIFSSFESSLLLAYLPLIKLLFCLFFIFLFSPIFPHPVLHKEKALDKCLLTKIEHLSII